MTTSVDARVLISLSETATSALVVVAASVGGELPTRVGACCGVSSSVVCPQGRPACTLGRGGAFALPDLNDD
jgi:predicted esterase YcpF (UPF0227 family)